MICFKDENLDLWRFYKNEYDEWLLMKLYTNTYYNFMEFIRSKDIGILPTGINCYEIVDANKWFKAKIKHGV